MNLEASLDIIISNLEQNNEMLELSCWLDNKINLEKYCIKLSKRE